MLRADGGLRGRVWLVTLSAVTLLTSACSDPARAVLGVQPLPPVDVVPPPPAPVLTEFPAVSSEAEVYLGDEGIYESSFAYHGGKIVSRYVFYPDGKFALQFLSARFSFFEYTGRYTRTESRIAFEWDGWSTAGKWEARGLLEGTARFRSRSTEGRAGR